MDKKIHNQESYDQKLHIQDSNDVIIKLIEKNRPFSILRLGFGPETRLLHNYLFHGEKFIQQLKSNTINYNEIFKFCGVYSTTNDINIFLSFYQLTFNSLKKCDLLASFHFDYSFDKLQNEIAQNVKVQQIHARSLEPFYVCEDNVLPWTRHLIGKKVLIIHPFIESIKKQLNNNFKFFKDRSKIIFEDKQEFLFYKSYQTQAHNYIHSDWTKTLDLMCDDINTLDFDIALLGCGGYGIPLCNFIKNNMNKSAIYIGGGLQLLFGIMGHRWDIREDWKKRILDNDMQCIYPDENERVKGFKSIENGCYW
jgi:hypothetical protein